MKSQEQIHREYMDREDELYPNLSTRMPVVHTPRCVELQNSAAAYRILNPDHCATCHGWGFLNMGHDIVEFWGAMTSTPDLREPCSDCADKGLCPRCGKVAELWAGKFDEETLPCVYCGFEYEVTDGEPERECECWMERIGI